MKQIRKTLILSSGLFEHMWHCWCSDNSRVSVMSHRPARKRRYCYVSILLIF